MSSEKRSRRSADGGQTTGPSAPPRCLPLTAGEAPPWRRWCRRPAAPPGQHPLRGRIARDNSGKGEAVSHSDRAATVCHAPVGWQPRAGHMSRRPLRKTAPRVPVIATSGPQGTALAPRMPNTSQFPRSAISPDLWSIIQNQPLRSKTPEQTRGEPPVHPESRRKNQFENDPIFPFRCTWHEKKSTTRLARRRTLQANGPGLVSGNAVQHRIGPGVGRFDRVGANVRRRPGSLVERCGRRAVGGGW